MAGRIFAGLQGVLEEMDKKQIAYEILFLDASDDVLIKRYKETRRQHPLSGSGRVDTGIAKERERIMFLKMKATYILDTSKMLTRELKIGTGKDIYKRPALSAICILQLCPLVLNMESPRIRIWCLMSVSCRILIILKD